MATSAAAGDELWGTGGCAHGVIRVAQPNPPTKDRFLSETIRLAACLDAVPACDVPDQIAEILRQGYLRFSELLLQRASVCLRTEDELVLDWVLDLIAARLRILQDAYNRDFPN